MCDSILAPRGSTVGELMLFGKNSDRQRNEAQTVEYFPGADHAPDAQLKCTYITIPQARHTYGVLLCRPFWMWGAEMGANERGVVIGNEAVHARSPAREEPALLGDDLVRLALERASTASAAVELITRLLELHGQGGNNGHLQPSYFNNAFLIADVRDAFVLETVGQEWLLERVTGVRAMSNRYSIERAERVSAGLAALIRDSGWSAEPYSNYAEVIANPNREHIGHARARRECSTALLGSRAPQLDVADMMRVLRDHGSGDRFHPEWRAECTIRRTVCMHAGAQDSPGQTTGSMVAQLHPEGAVYWVTGTAAPCTSIFKPVLMDAPLPPHGSLPTDRFDQHTLWWRHERLHRAALMGEFDEFLTSVRAERDALEADFRVRIATVMKGGTLNDRRRVIAECWKEAIETEDRWYAHMEAPSAASDTPYAAGWTRMNRIAGIADEGERNRA
jgi:dipeptidase